MRTLRSEHRSITLRHGIAYYASPGMERPGRGRMKVTAYSAYSAFTAVETIVRHLRTDEERKVHNYLFNTPR